MKDKIYLVNEIKNYKKIKLKKCKRIYITVGYKINQY